MIIDCHCHAGKGDGLTGPWDTAAPLERLPAARSARPASTARCSSPRSTRTTRVANREVARIVASRPDRFYGFAFVHPERDRGRVDALVERRWSATAFVGIKVHRHDAPHHPRDLRGGAGLRAAGALRRDGRGLGRRAAGARSIPEVDFIIPHLGSFADDWRAQLALIDHLVRHPNVYADTSGVRRFDLLEQAVERAGARKILFGSDGPWLHPGVELAKVRALGLSPPGRSSWCSAATFCG